MHTEIPNAAMIRVDAPGASRPEPPHADVAAPGPMHDLGPAWQAVLRPMHVPVDLLQQLLLLSNTRTVAAGGLVLSSKETARYLVMLVQGDVGLGVQQASAANAPFHPEQRIVGPAWLDLASVWLGRTHLQDAVALSAVRIAMVSRTAYLALMGRTPELARTTLVGLARQVQALTQNTHDLLHKDADARLCAWLVQRCGVETGASGAQRLQLHERKRDIASQLGITPETLSRLLRQLRTDGLLEVHGYTISVLNLEGLRTRAQS